MNPRISAAPDAPPEPPSPRRGPARLSRSVCCALTLIVWTGCTGVVGGTPDDPSGSTDAGCVEPTPSGGTDAGEKSDVLAPSRLLRRTSLALRGTPPTDEEFAALEAAGDDTAQQAFVDAFVDQTLGQPTFYRTMFEHARDWFNIPLTPLTADAPEYGVQQQRAIQRCPAGTAKAGAWKYFRGDNTACDGVKTDGSPVEETALEPWWAPGTTVTLVGAAANTSTEGSINVNGSPVPVTCAAAGPEGTCGCGPNAVRCHADFQQYAGFENFLHYNEHGQRRLVSEEPARLFAHLAWHDRPMTDLILGAYSVAPTNLQAAYVMQGLAGGATGLLADDSWWRPSRFAGAAVDPDHAPSDPLAWREYPVPARNPFLLAERDYRYDPRTQAGPSRGVPAAGMLTSMGFLTGYPRERVRGARALETLACEVLSPPLGQKFNEYRRDPGTEGPCQHCHSRLDPAAIHFKRFAKAGSAFEGYGAKYPMPGVGTEWHWPAQWRTGAYPYGGDPFSHWNRWYAPDTKLTPVTEAQAQLNPEAIFLDFLPPEQTLLGQQGDGTVGPLGFAKLIVAAGAFDRCVVRHLHAQVLGRDIDPAREAGYLDEQVARFLAGGRKVRPFVKSLTQSSLFRRGR
ncbi:hypothetical protein OV208_00275 [Corallococcus sp. bb12-1]|uniref:hypothetical protein n=1 Tax=Corallococcus sp. bb12-1 TaxID=2996784 RepID=UPI00227058AB|nr:hypothetical protein [Corallococcus sp. bb12-1]MCY1039737.1 hypothetical protein [Corallococcus sp. bb12-1]